jgi:hypothetical protein
MSNRVQGQISKTVIEKLLEVIPEGSTVLELGTGFGTIPIAEKFKVISIENNPHWHQGVSELIEVPVVDQLNIPGSISKRFPLYKQWYDAELLRTKLAGKQYDAIIVDGPESPSRRPGFLFNRSIFDQTVPVIIDDFHRPYDMRTGIMYAQAIVASKFEIFGFDEDKPFARILP